jgi:two-component system chemotaxis sensor kinase CheA
MREPDEVIDEFIAESSQLMILTEQELRALKSGNERPETIPNAFRGFHTVRGSAGFLGYTNLEKLTRVTETVLGRMRSGALVVTPEHLHVLLDATRSTKSIIANIDSSGTEGDSSYDDLLVQLQNLLNTSTY